jgi:hypothetical protein
MWYVDCKVCDRKLSRTIWYAKRIRTDDEGWCHVLSWDALWIGTYLKECFHDLIWSAVRIGNEVSERFHDQFVVLCGLEHMIEDDVMT